jgi:exodeoxyribonuclease V gamma subunit
VPHFEARLSVYSGNRLHNLLRHFSDAVSRDPLPPAERETVVVQSQGMARWVHLRVSELQGVAGGFFMPFPREFVDGLADKLCPDDRKERRAGARFRRDALTWRIFGHLEAARNDPQFAEPANYFRDDENGRRRLELASRIADLFDNYQLYRVPLLESWSGGSNEGSQWQAELWRRLVSECPGQDLASRLHGLKERLGAPDVRPLLPDRLTVFGVATLPPIFLDLLVGLSKHVPVSIYVVWPTPDYWGDVTKRSALDEESEENDTHPLLAALGKQGRDFFNMIVDADAGAIESVDYEDPGEETALHTIQSDIYRLTKRSDDEKAAVSDDDLSLQIHSCHSKLREMEVLRDRLLELFEAIPGLDPGDVAVMLPDVEAYAAAVHATFDREDGPPKIPYSIADRRADSEHEASRSAVRLLRLATGRTTVSDVLDFLDLECFRRAAEISSDERTLIADWVQGAGARWGIDAQHRIDEFDAPSMEANTWRFAMDRMLLGRAVESGGEPIAGIAPFDAAASNEDLLERFFAFAGTMFRFAGELRGARPLPQWLLAIETALGELASATNADDEEALARSFSALSAAVQDCGDEVAETEVSADALADYLEHALDQDGFGSPFLTGRVTFCAMKPMRSIPFSVICMAGLDEGVFPRRDRAPGIDLITAKPKLGDRSVREDDRYLFLESIFAARDALLLSYVGRSVKDNSERAPSSVLAVLIDSIEDTFVATREENDDSVKSSTISRFLTEHPLQPFSKRYFNRTHARVFSYSEKQADAAKCVADARRPDPVFASGELAKCEEMETNEVSVANLLRFWRNPSEDYCRRVLGIHLPAREEEEDQQEPAVANALLRTVVGGTLVEPDGDARAKLLRLAAASGRLPPGIAGETALGKWVREAESMLRTAPPTAQTLDVNLSIDGWTVRGRIEGVGPEGLWIGEMASLGPRRRLSAWIRHLLLIAAIENDGLQIARRTHLVGREEEAIYQSAGDASKALRDLIEGYRFGRRRPLPFAEDSSFEYARSVFNDDGTPDETLLAKAGTKWGMTGSYPNERKDPYTRLAFRGQAPLSDDPASFSRWATTVWNPAFAAEVSE